VLILFNFASTSLSAIIGICALTFVAAELGIVSRHIKHFFFIGALFSPFLIIL